MVEKKLKQFNVMLTPGQFQEMEQLSEFLSVKKATVLRTALHDCFKMTVGKIPVCANGERCYCPERVKIMVEVAAAGKEPY